MDETMKFVEEDVEEQLSQLAELEADTAGMTYEEFLAATENPPISDGEFGNPDFAEAESGETKEPATNEVQTDDEVTEAELGQLVVDAALNEDFDGVFMTDETDYSGLTQGEWESLDLPTDDFLYIVHTSFGYYVYQGNIDDYTEVAGEFDDEHEALDADDPDFDANLAIIRAQIDSMYHNEYGQLVAKFKTERLAQKYVSESGYDEWVLEL